MSHILFEQLENAGFMRGTSLNRAAIEHASLVDILDLAQQSCELTSATDRPQDNSVLAQSASLSLGCGRWPCAEINCRLNRAQQLAHFAALYGDRVYIRNIFSDYVEHTDEKRLPDESTLRAWLAEDLRLLAYLRPLIESKKILPITPPNYCLHCLAKHSLGHEDEKQLRNVFRSLTRRLEEEIDVSLSCVADRLYMIVAHGPDDLLEHGYSALLSQTLPPHLD